MRAGRGGAGHGTAWLRLSGFKAADFSRKIIFFKVKLLTAAESCWRGTGDEGPRQGSVAASRVRVETK